MAISDVLTIILTWFCFGAVAFLGAFTAYSAIKSRAVQVVGAFLLAMLGGFTILVLFGYAIGKLTN